MYWFPPNMYNTYSMGNLDIALKANELWNQSKVLYCTVERVEPGGLFEQKLSHNQECIVFQDELGDYYFYDFSHGGGEYLAKFRWDNGEGWIWMW